MQPLNKAMVNLANFAKTKQDLFTCTEEEKSQSSASGIFKLTQQRAQDVSKINQ